MEFLAGTWWLWLIVAVVCYGYVCLNQLMRMKRMFHSDFDDTFKNFFSGLIPMILLGLAGSVCFILFIVGIVAKFING